MNERKIIAVDMVERPEKRSKWPFLTTRVHHTKLRMPKGRTKELNVSRTVNRLKKVLILHIWCEVNTKFVTLIYSHCKLIYHHSQSWEPTSGSLIFLFSSFYIILAEVPRAAGVNLQLAGHLLFYWTVFKNVLGFQAPRPRWERG